jgi:hypothetical protein
MKDIIFAVSIAVSGAGDKAEIPKPCLVDAVKPAIVVMQPRLTDPLNERKPSSSRNWDFNFNDFYGINTSNANTNSTTHDQDTNTMPYADHASGYRFDLDGLNGPSTNNGSAIWC